MVILYSILAGILGRIGGRGKDGSWLDKITNTKVRDLGIPTLFIVYHVPVENWLGLGFCSILMFFALTTYWDTLFTFDNFGFAGFMVGMSLLPFVAWQVVLVKAVVIGTLWWALEEYMPRLWFYDRGVLIEFLRYSLTFFILVV